MLPDECAVLDTNARDVIDIDSVRAFLDTVAIALEGRVSNDELTGRRGKSQYSVFVIDEVAVRW